MVIGYDRVNRFWDLAAGAALATVEAHGKPALCVAVTPDGKTAFSGGADELLVKWPTRPAEDR